MNSYFDNGIKTEEIKNNPNFIYDGYLEKIREKGNNYSEEEEKEMALALAKLTIDFYTKNRKNYSLDSEIIMKKIINGKEPTEEEIIELTSTEEEYNNYKNILEEQKKMNEKFNKNKFDEISEKTKNGTISLEDLDFLIEQMGFDKNDADKVKQSFINSGKVVEQYEESKITR